MPKDPISKKAMEKPDEAVPEVERSEEFSDKNIEAPRRGVRKRGISFDPPRLNKAADLGHYRGPRARRPEQPDLYEGLWSMADGSPRQVRPSRQKSTVPVRCPLCGSELRATAIDLECPGCHAREAARVSRIDADPPPSRSPSSVPAQVKSRWQAAEPIFPEALPSFFVRPVPTPAEASTAQTSTSRSHMAPMVWVALGVTVLLGAVAGAGYWQINPKHGQVAPEVAASLKMPPNSALPVPAMVPSRPPPQLVVDLAQLGDKPPPDEPTTTPVAAPPVAAPAAEAPASVPVAPVPQALAAAKPVAAPRDDIFVVRFDSKLPGLTPSGLRALDAALRAADKGRKVRIQIDGCEDHDSMPTGIDCAARTRRLKWILADRGVEHPADLIASLYPQTISVIH